MKFQFIKDHRSSFPVKKMCHTLNVSQSGYYRWNRSPVSLRIQKNDQLKKRITSIYDEHRGMAGSPLITADLRSEPAYRTVSRPRVAKLMRSMGLRCKTVRKFVATTDSKHSEPVAPNVLNREFTPSAPNIAWVSDITYIRVGSKWFYLTVFIDLFSRMVIGWDFSESLERHSMIRAFNKALLTRNPAQGLIIHSDRGVQYASTEFRRKIVKKGFIQSMSRKGNCWDNAVAESFFHSLKTQFVYHTKFQTREEAERSLFWYIEIYYNRRRRHSTNGYLAPAHYEQEWWNLKKVA